MLQVNSPPTLLLTSSLLSCKYKKSFLLNEGDIGMANYEKTSGTRGCIPHPYIFVQLLQDSEA